ncbi:MAG: hypothetical protein ACYCPM_03975 [Acidobacteriaceae bacterium]
MPAISPINSPTVSASGAHAYVRARPIRSLWVGWHLLSLDAPTVAVVWCWFFAAAFGVSLPSTALITLALGTWFVYVADRLLDGWRSTDMTTLRDRHWFYLRHRKPFVIAWIVAAIPLAYLIFFRVQPAVRTDDIVLCMIGTAYFLLIHNRPAKHHFSKEFFVGFLFSLATAVPTWTRLREDRVALMAAVVTFGAACWLNCVAIQVWEDAEAMREGLHTIFSEGPPNPAEIRPRGLTEFLGNHLAAFAMAVGVLAFSLGCIPAARTAWPLFAAVALSSILFLALIRKTERFSALSLRILADGALLTPLILFLHLR